MGGCDRFCLVGDTLMNSNMKFPLYLDSDGGFPEFELVIYGRPASKKNSMIKTRYGLIQSKAWRDYEDDAVQQLRLQWRRKPIETAVQVTAKYFMPDRRNWPDMIGLMQGTADLLEKAGVIGDDSYIGSWDYTRFVDIDKENPRTLIRVKICDRSTFVGINPKLIKKASK